MRTAMTGTHPNSQKIIMLHESAMMTIKPVHTRVNGRGRYFVSGLRGSGDFKAALETRLMTCPRVTRLFISPVTGTLLIYYDVSFSHREMTAVIRKTAEEIQQWRAAGEKDPEIRPGEGKLKSTARRTLDKVKKLIRPRTGDEPRNWFTRPVNEVLHVFETDPKSGISTDAVALRRREYGENILPKTESRSGIQIFLEQMNSLPVYLLGAAAGVSVLTGGLLDAVIILGVVLANSAIGFVTETRAEKNIDALNDLVHHMAEVIRDGKPVFVSAEEVVPGDILVLKPGSYVPADCRIIKAFQLTIDESMLTGENLPVEKFVQPIMENETALADRRNMAFMGTAITGGQGLAVVVATGRTTEIGKLKILLDDTLVPRMPIERQLDAIGNKLILGCGLVCTGVFGLGLFMGFGFLNMLRMSISLAAAAVPEGLPTIATVNFALGINRMKKNNIIVRHLPAVDTLGAIQTLCLDKTGTITENRMKATTLYTGEKWLSIETGGPVLGGEKIRPSDLPELEMLYTVCALCCETRINGKCADGRLDISGSATESALTELVDGGGIDVKKIRKASPLIKINHRSEQRLFMSTVHRSREQDGFFVMVKGSPLDVLSRCDTHLMDGKTLPLTAGTRLRIQKANIEMAENALRVLGFAFCWTDLGPGEEPETQMTWLGLIGMMDPPRKGIRELIRRFHQAGVRTVMITGDQQISACAIAREIDLSQGRPLEIMDASELARLDEAELIQRARTVHVYSRVTPSQKLKIVNAIKASGQTVAMTGDGINDSPALKAADIGIAMGRTGTDLARDVADVVLSRDNIELMANALADGRCIYQNIRKAVHFSLSTNISEIQLILTALACGLNSPLNVMQLLWINLISDVLPGLALSAEKPEQDVMEQQPRNPDDPLFSKNDFRGMFIESGTITAGAMGAFLYGISRYGAGAMAGGLAFQALTFGQLFHALSCRSETTGIFTKKKLPRNPYMNWAIGGSLMIQVMSIFLPPLRSLLGLSAVTLMDGLVIGAASTLPFLFNEANKAVKETLSLKHRLPDRGGTGEEASDVNGTDLCNTEDPCRPDREEMEAGFGNFCN